MNKLIIEFEPDNEFGAVLNVVDENDCCINMFTGDDATKVYNMLIDTPTDSENETKRCDNCANSTEPGEVDHGCYMCSKGYENNYKPME